MKKANLISFSTLAALCLLFVFAVHAAEKAPGVREGGKHRKMMYDPKTVETIAGEVVKVKEFQHRRRPGTGIGLIIKTDKEEIPVHLGPSSFLEKQGFVIGEKDKIEVTGSRITGKRGKTFLLAAQVKKGDALLILRGDDGVPAWGPGKGQKMRDAQPMKEMKDSQ